MRKRRGGYSDGYRVPLREKFRAIRGGAGALPTGIIEGDPSHISHHNSVHELLAILASQTGAVAPGILPLDTLANQPVASPANERFFYVTTDTAEVFLSDGAVWLNLTTSSGAGVFVNIEDFGAVGDDATDSGAAINAAYVAARLAGGTVFWPDGIYRASVSIVVTCATFAFNAVLKTDASPGIQVGDGTQLFSAQRVMLPKVYRLTKNWGVAPGPGAGVINADVGVRIDHVYSSEIYVQQVRNFSIGLLLANDNGCSYNKVYIGILENNAIALRLLPEGSGWVNDNQFFGGKYEMYSGEGSAIPGTRYIQIPDYPNNSQNNNLFFGGSVEADGPEFHLECWGAYNQFIGVRWESLPAKVWWGAAGSHFASDNLILGGYATETIVYTDDPLARYNRVLGSRFNREELTAAAGHILVNGGGSDLPIMSFLEAGDSPFTTDAVTDYLAAFSAQRTRFKRKTDAFARIYIDHVTGAIHFGRGTLDTVAVEPFFRWFIEGISVAKGDMIAETLGRGFSVREGAGGGRQGVATLVAGTILVPNTAVTAVSRIFLTAQDNASIGALRVSARTPGISFTITSSIGGDVGAVAYEIFEPAP